ncbi:MAG: hypothetical protein ACRDQ7_15670 [Haloechinothrix sp.]
MSEIQAVARAALALNALAGSVLDEQTSARAVAFHRLAVSGAERVRVKDDDGEELGSVSLTKGRVSARVADQDAYMQWVAKRYPEQVETVQVVRSAFTERVLNTAKATGVPVDTETGEVIPGVEVSDGSPGITIRPNAVAKERMRALLADAGLLALPSAEDAGA